MNSINLYKYNGESYFDLDIDADATGLCMIELLINEYAKLAKEKLADCDFDDALKLCQSANRLNEVYIKAKKEISEQALGATKEVEDDC